MNVNNLLVSPSYLKFSSLVSEDGWTPTLDMDLICLRKKQNQVIMYKWFAIWFYT